MTLITKNTENNLFRRLIMLEARKRIFKILAGHVEVKCPKNSTNIKFSNYIHFKIKKILFSLYTNCFFNRKYSFRQCADKLELKIESDHAQCAKYAQCDKLGLKVLSLFFHNL